MMRDRERYPLTSQIIEEEKIPEFGTSTLAHCGVERGNVSNTPTAIPEMFWIVGWERAMARCSVEQAASAAGGF